MKRDELIKQIEKKRRSKVISYITSDRIGPLNAKVAMDIIPILARQLESIGKVENIDLFLYSTGGDTMVPWRLVSMIRENCRKFSVVIPYKAHSAATMIALGADEIIMSNMSELSPIDPTTGNLFNPTDPQNVQNKIPISVEDVMAYFDLAKNKFGIKKDDDLTKVFTKFVESSPQIHPLALGNINRIHNLIRILARKLLKSHTVPMKGNDIDSIVNYFTERLYSHQYVIGRREAKEELGLSTVSYADEEISKLMSDLYNEYRKEAELGSAVWNPELELGTLNQAVKSYKIAFVDTAKNSNYFGIDVEFKRQQIMVQQIAPGGPVQVPQEQVVFRFIKQGWE